MPRAKGFCFHTFVVLGLHSAAFTQAVGHGTYGGSDPRQVSIGNFRVNIQDSRLPVALGRRNITLLEPSLGELFQGISDYWDTYSDANIPSSSDQVSNITSIASRILQPEEFSKFSDGLVNASLEAAKEDFTPDILEKYHLPNPDVVFEYLYAVANLSTNTWWWAQGAYIGVGWESECAANINEVLGSKGEWEKVGSNGATTLMALVPTILAFGHLYVPRSSEAYTTSALVGLATSFYTLGLPAKSMSAVKQSNIHTLALFGIVALTTIGSLGKVYRNGNPKVEPDLKDLQKWSRSGSGDEIKERFSSIKENAKNWEPRWHLWYMPSLLVAGCQAVIFGLAIYPLFRDLGVPKFILRCEYGGDKDWTAKYIGVSAAINTLVRYLKWENSSHERVKIYTLSEASVDALQALIRKTAHLPNSLTTATELPPLLPPILLRLRGFGSSAWRKCTSIFASSVSKSNLPPVNATPRRKITILAVITGQLKHIRRQVAYTFTKKNLIGIFKSGFGRDAPISSRRWRPVYLLIHLSTEGRNPLLTLLTGFIEAALLLVLSFFFAAQWGGNLVITAVALLLLVVFITLGRALGLIYVWVSSQVWGLTVINCDSVDEIRGTLRIVCSMENVLVHVNGATYFDGYRMDGRDGWDGFLEKYERGMLDYDTPQHNSSASSSFVGKPPTPPPKTNVSPGITDVGTSPTTTSTTQSSPQQAQTNPQPAQHNPPQTQSISPQNQANPPQTQLNPPQTQSNPLQTQPNPQQTQSNPTQTQPSPQQTQVSSD